MWKVVFTIIVISTVFSTNIIAQKSIDSKHKWQVGLDLLPIIKDTSFHMKETIIMKMRLDDASVLRARFGVLLQQVRNWSTREPKADTIYAHRPRFYISLGYEKQIIEKGRISVNAGAEAFAFYWRYKLRSHLKTVSATPATDREFFRDDFEIKTGLNTFINVEYNITPHIAINVESFWQFAYRKERYKDETFDFGILAQEGGRTIDRFVTQLQPISSVNLMYTF